MNYKITVSDLKVSFKPEITIYKTIE